jgi:hypothetical protein
MLGALDHAPQELARAARSVVRDDGVECLEPLARLGRVDVGARAVASGGLYAIDDGSL